MLWRVPNTILGIWLMAAPAVLGYGGGAATNDRIVGPIIASLAIIAMSDVAISLRYVNVLLGTWLLLAPFVIGYAGATATYNSLIVGLLVILFALPAKEVTTKMGGGWSALVR